MKRLPNKELSLEEYQYLIKNYISRGGEGIICQGTRKDTVIGLGGGVVGDLASLVASTYMRGINYIAMPTSLLSMVDSSVGGKTAINLDSGKNLLGTFFQPDAVYINVDFLNTLPKREVTCGLGEIMKYAFIDSRITKEAIEKAGGTAEQI